MTAPQRTRIDWALAAVFAVVLGLWGSALLQWLHHNDMRGVFGFTTNNIFWVVTQNSAFAAVVLVAGSAGLGATTRPRRLLRYAAVGLCAAIAALGVVIAVVQVALGARFELMVQGWATTVSAAVAGIGLLLAGRIGDGSATVLGLAAAVGAWLIRFAVGEALFLHDVHRMSASLGMRFPYGRHFAETGAYLVLTALLLLGVWSVGHGAHALAVAGAALIGLTLLRSLLFCIGVEPLGTLLAWDRSDGLQLAAYVLATVFAVLAVLAGNRRAEEPMAEVALS